MDVDDLLARLPVVETTLEVRETTREVGAILAPRDAFTLECSGELYARLVRHFDAGWLDPLHTYWQERGLDLPSFLPAENPHLPAQTFTVATRGQSSRTVQFPDFQEGFQEAVLLECARAVHQQIPLWLGRDWMRQQHPQLEPSDLKALLPTLRSLAEAGHALLAPQNWWVYRTRFTTLAETLIVASECQPVSPLHPRVRLSHLLGALPVDFVRHYRAALDPLLEGLCFDSYQPGLDCQAIHDFLSLWRHPLSPPGPGLFEACLSMVRRKPGECARAWLLSRTLRDPRQEFYLLAERNPEEMLRGLLRWSEQSPPRLPRFQECALLAQVLEGPAPGLRVHLEEILGSLPRVTHEEPWVLPILRDFFRCCSSLFAGAHAPKN